MKTLEKNANEDRGRDGRDAAASQGRPAATRSFKWQERDSPLEPPEGASPAHTLTLAQ